MVPESEKEKKTAQRRIREKYVLFFLLLLSVCSSICFGAQSSQNNIQLFHAEFSKNPVLTVQNCENSNSAYRGNQLQLLQSIFRTIRGNHFMFITKAADIFTQDITDFSLNKRHPARDSFAHIQDFSLTVCLKSSLPVRAGPIV